MQDDSPRVASSPSVRLSKEYVNALPLYAYEGGVILVHTPEQKEDALAYFSQQKIIGFDTETKPSFRKGVSHQPALLQLAGEDRVYIFHFGWQPFMSDIAAILASSTHIKAGVAVRDDVLALQKMCDFSPHAMYDLSSLARQKGVVEQGLRGLAARYLGIRISKGERCSDWSRKHLTPRQIRYAATDAWVSRELYLAMTRP